jgi:amino acid adenylation domain-containing protein
MTSKDTEHIARPSAVLSGIFKAIQLHCDLVAVSSEHRAISYSALGTVCAHMQALLLAKEIPRGSTIALYFQDRWLVIPGILATAALGCPFMPLDPAIPEQRIDELIHYASASVVLTDIPDISTKVSRDLVPHVVMDPSGLRHILLTAKIPDISAALETDDFATVYFTSGSTGHPKAIAGRLAGVDAFVQWEIDALAVKAGARVSQLTSPAFDGFLKDVLVPLSVGGTVCVTPASDYIARPSELALWLAREAVEVLHLVPSVLRRLLHFPDLGHRLRSLKAIVLAGETVTSSDVRRLQFHFDGRVTVLNLYGPTETTLTKICHVIRPEDAMAHIVPIGTPMPGTEVLIVDDTGELCGIEAVGEIYLITSYSALGYLGRPDLTAGKFVPDPRGLPNLSYRTGDIGRLNRFGEYEFLGRIDSQVKVRGVRIEPGEIEAIFRRNDSVVTAAVIPRYDAAGDAALCCYCVLNKPLSPTSLREHATQYLPSYMLPDIIEVVADVPLTPNGKLDRLALSRCPPQRYALASPELTEQPSSTEQALMKAFGDVLGLQTVARLESFFVLGGHSLLAVELLAKISNLFSLELPVRELYHHSSISALASYIDELRRHDNA